MGVSSVEAVVYGIKWAHSMAGLVSCPVSHPLVKSAPEGAKRKLVRPKEPLSVDTVQAIANFYSSDVSLAVLRFLFTLLVGFHGFFRIDEINSFRLHDIIVNTDHMTIYVAKRKNDSIGRAIPPILPGLRSLDVQLVLLKRSLRFYHMYSRINRFLLFVVLFSLKPENAFTLVGVCLCLRKESGSLLSPSSISKFSMHSMRSGAASNPACRRIPGDILDMHAGWRCPSSKNRYIKHTVKARLTVPAKALLL